MAQIQVERARRLRGTLRPPSDKSLTHRSLLFASIATSPSLIRFPLTSEDAEATERCLLALGANIRHRHQEIEVVPQEWQTPKGPLDCGNSGTTLRLMSGLIASRNLDAWLTGDASLSRRPMKRIGEPLRLMGAGFEGDTAPIHIQGGQLRGIDYTSPVASAQVKSSLLLAGLRAEGETSVTEPSKSRDHTERLFRALGVPLREEGLKVTVQRADPWAGFEIKVPGDISSAAFMIVAACLVPESDLTITDLSVNPTRTGLLDVLAQAGLECALSDEREELGEPVATLNVRHQGVPRAFHIAGDLVPRLIDEIPILAVLATQCEGTSTIRDAQDARVKESDRILVVGEGLRRMGAQVEILPDGLEITGPTPLKGTEIETHLDHRIGMAFAVAGLVAEGSTTILNSEAIASSYPSFEDDLRRLISS